MDKFLERHKLLKLTQEKTEYPERPIKSNEIFFFFEEKRKTKAQMASLVNFTKHLREELIIILHKLFQKTEKGTLPNSLYEASITLIPKPEKDITTKLQTNVP